MYPIIGSCWPWRAQPSSWEPLRYNKPSTVSGKLFNAKPNTREDERLEVLITLVEAYEDEHYPMGGTSDPISMIQHVMEAQGLTRKDLEPYIGPRQRVWEIMEKRRQLTLAMIRRLEAGLGIPAEVLIRKYELAQDVQHSNRQC